MKTPNRYRIWPRSSGAPMRPLKTNPAHRTVRNGLARLRQFILVILALTACSGEPPPDTWVGYPRFSWISEDLREIVWRCWKLHEVGGELVFLVTAGNDSAGVYGTGSGPPRELPEVPVHMVPVERNDSIYTPSRNTRIPSSIRTFLDGTHAIHRSTGSLYFYSDDDWDPDDPEAGLPSGHSYTAYRSACPDDLAEEAMERIREGG